MLANGTRSPLAPIEPNSRTWGVTWAFRNVTRRLDECEPDAGGASQVGVGPQEHRRADIGGRQPAAGPSLQKPHEVLL